MATELSQELRIELAKHGDQPIELIDPASEKVYVLLPLDQFDRLRPLFESTPISKLEQKTLLLQAGERAGWNDPEMDAYDRYDEHRNTKP